MHFENSRYRNNSARCGLNSETSPGMIALHGMREPNRHHPRRPRTSGKIRSKSAAQSRLTRGARFRRRSAGRRRGAPSRRRSTGPASPRGASWVERFGRRGTEPFEPFEPFEFFQNRNFPEIFLRKFKNSRKFQHDFLNYRRNSDKISSKSEQKSVKRIQK